MHRKQLTFRYVVTATLLGNTLEWYDACLFGLFIPTFSLLFFPMHDPKAALINTLLIFATGTVLRPLGGVLFGFIGDRFGRKKALIGSILLMVVPIFGMSFLPTYAQIGAVAWVLLCFSRLLQGLAAGGEFSGCVTFIVESSPPLERGFFGSFTYFGIILGALLGGLDFYLLGSHISKESFQQWGWRLLTLTGVLLGLVAVWMRSHLVETPLFETMRHSSEILRDPIRNLFQSHKKSMAKLIGITILETFGFNLLITFSLTYFYAALQIPLSNAIGWHLLTLIIVLAMIPCFGKLASHLGPIRAARYAAWAFLIFSMPLYGMLQFEGLRLVGIAGLAILLAFYMAPMPAIFCELFPTNIRFSGIGIAFNVTAGLIGGFSPFFALHAIEASGFRTIPSLFLIAGAIVALLTLRTIRPRALYRAK